MIGRAVIFDMDGVIVDSEPRHERAFLEVVKSIGYEATHGLRFADYLGRSDNELWEDFVKRHRPKESTEQLLAMKRALVIEIIRREQPLFKGLSQLVKRLSPLFKLAVASGSEHAVIDAVLALEGLRSFFPVVVSASEVKRGKPAPDIFLKAASLMNVNPDGCWVIEDSKPGVAGALAAGMKVIAITNTHSAEELSSAHFVVRNNDEIEDLLLNANRRELRAPIL